MDMNPTKFRVKGSPPYYKLYNEDETVEYDKMGPGNLNSEIVVLLHWLGVTKETE